MIGLLQNIVDAANLGSLYTLAALGVGLLFGILRLVNFAHGDFISIGAYALIVPSFEVTAQLFIGTWNWTLMIPTVTLIVVIVALISDALVFQPLRRASAPTLMIASFAVSYVIQNGILMVYGARPKAANLWSGLDTPILLGDLRVPLLQIITIGVTLTLMVALSLFLKSTRYGVMMRAAAEDFRMAQYLGVNGNFVIGLAFAISGILATAVSLLYLSQTGTLSPTMGVPLALFAFVATVIGGMGSLPGAVVGGFLVGFVVIMLQAYLPEDLRVFRDAFAFTFVILILLVRPSGIVRTRAFIERVLKEPDMPHRARLSLLRRIWPLLALCVALTALVAITSLGSEQLQVTMTEMLIRLIVVVGIYVFIGNSGILSFGHVGFMCVGAYAAAWATVDPNWKQMMLTGLPDFLQQNQYGFLPAVAGGGLLAGLVALLLGAAIMRLSGIAGSIATFAFLAIVNSVYSNWETVTAATSSIIGVPTVVGPWVAWAFAIGALVVAYLFQVSRFGLMLRASRDDEVAAKSSAVGVVKMRLIAFVVSAMIVGVAGALYGHFLGILTADTFYLSLTFVTLAMLVVGGVGSLAGAVTGVVAVTLVVEVLRHMEAGIPLGSTTLHLPQGSQEIGLGIVMALIMIFRPSGLTKGREVPWPFAPAARRRKIQPVRAG